MEGGTTCRLTSPLQLKQLPYFWTVRSLAMAVFQWACLRRTMALKSASIHSTTAKKLGQMVLTFGLMTCALGKHQESAPREVAVDLPRHRQLHGRLPCLSPRLAQHRGRRTRLAQHLNLNLNLNQHQGRLRRHGPLRCPPPLRQHRAAPSFADVRI